MRFELKKFKFWVDQIAQINRLVLQRMQETLFLKS